MLPRIPRRPTTSPPPIPQAAVAAAAAPVVPRELRTPRKTDPPTAPVLHSAMVGRARQLTLLREVVRRATESPRTQLITVVGNRGTGKSRLTRELCIGLPAPIRIFYGRARAEQPLSALSSLLRDRFGLAAAASATPPEDPARRVTDQVGKILGEAEPTEVLHFLGGYLGLEFASSPFLRLVADDPAHHAGLARTVFRRLVELDAASGPLVLVLDDLQWADAETLATLSELARRVTGSSIVIVVATRPEMLVRCPSWGLGAVAHERVDLRNLDPDDAEVMFANLLAQCGQLPSDLVQAAVEITGGNPQFIDQLVRLYLRQGAIDTAGGRWQIDLDAAMAIELPIGIADAIEARIAALAPDERDLLEKASVFGNVFWLSAVVALTRLETSPRRVDALELEWGEGEPVRRRITDLVHALAERDYLLVLEPADSTVEGDVEIVFKHNLEREEIVTSIDLGRSSRYHLTAAQWLESRLTDKSEEQLEFLTGLYERGGDLDQAARCYLLAADRARARWASEDARTMYERGLTMLGKDDTPARIDALHNLGDVLDTLGETELAKARFDEMLALSWRYDNPRKAAAAHSRIARLLRRQGNYDATMNHLRRANQLFTAARDERGVASSLDDMGRNHWVRGAYGPALECHRQALTMRKELGDRRSIALSVANLGRVHFATGAFKAAIAEFREALDLRRDINDLPGVAESLCDLAAVHHADDNVGLALELLVDAQQVVDEIRDRQTQIEVLLRVSDCKLTLGQLADVLVDLDRARGLAQTMGDRLALVKLARRTAEYALASGDHVAAARDARTALQHAEELGVRAQIGTAHRVIATVAAAQAELNVAAAEFQQAIDVLSMMGNELELARAWQAFGDLQAAQGQPAAAVELQARASDVFARLRAAAGTE